MTLETLLQPLFSFLAQTREEDYHLPAGRKNPLRFSRQLEWQSARPCGTRALPRYRDELSGKCCFVIMTRSASRPELV